MNAKLLLSRKNEIFQFTWCTFSQVLADTLFFFKHENS